MTNGDRVRALSDEALAVFLRSVYFMNRPGEFSFIDRHIEDSDEYWAWLSWLREGCLYDK